MRAPRKSSNKNLPNFTPIIPAAKKAATPKPGDEPRDQYGFTPVLAEKLPDPLQAALRNNPAQIPVIEELLTPFLPDGINGQVTSQDSEETDHQSRIEADNSQVNKKSPREQGQFFRNGQAQPAEKEDHEEPGVDERLRVADEKKGLVRQGFSGSSRSPLSRGRFSKLPGVPAEARRVSPARSRTLSRPVIPSLVPATRGLCPEASIFLPNLPRTLRPSPRPVKREGKGTGEREGYSIRRNSGGRLPPDSKY